MPLKSEAQRRWMWSNKPEMAARWEKETPQGVKLPEHVEKEPPRFKGLRKHFSQKK